MMVERQRTESIDEEVVGMLQFKPGFTYAGLHYTFMINKAQPLICNHFATVSYILMTMKCKMHPAHSMIGYPC
jgi:hypothetical protein